MSNACLRAVATLALALVTFSGTVLDQTTGQPLTRPGTHAISVQSSDAPQQTFHACSTTLDYDCAGSAGSGPG